MLWKSAWKVLLRWLETKMKCLKEFIAHALMVGWRSAVMRGRLLLHSTVSRQDILSCHVSVSSIWRKFGVDKAFPDHHQCHLKQCFNKTSYIWLICSSIVWNFCFNLSCISCLNLFLFLCLKLSVPVKLSGQDVCFCQRCCVFILLTNRGDLLILMLEEVGEKVDVKQTEEAGGVEAGRSSCTWLSSNFSKYEFTVDGSPDCSLFLLQVSPASSSSSIVPWECVFSFWELSGSRAASLSFPGAWTKWQTVRRAFFRRRRLGLGGTENNHFLLGAKNKTRKKKTGQKWGTFSVGTRGALPLARKIDHYPIKIQSIAK